MRTSFHLIPALVMLSAAALAQTVPSSPTHGGEMVQRALAMELRAAQDHSHPMHYRLRKSSPRLTTTKELVETQDGIVALLVAVNDRPPSAEDSAKEKARLGALLADPGSQHHRKQSQEQDTGRALKVLRALPTAFLYNDAGPLSTAPGGLERFTFSPNPNFDPPDLETQVLTALRGELWIDPVHLRVTHLEGHLQQDVNFGWGVLGRLNRGGWIVIEQAEVAPGVWRIVRFKMTMTGRVLFKTRSFDTSEDETQFAPVPAGMTYQQGVELLRSSAAATPASGGSGRDSRVP